jgi:hypothetical protein
MSEKIIHGLVDTTLSIVGDKNNPLREKNRGKIIEDYKQNIERVFRDFRPVQEAFEAVKEIYEMKKFAYERAVSEYEEDLKTANDEMNNEYRNGKNDVVAEAKFAASRAILSATCNAPFYDTHIVAVVVDAADKANTAAGYYAAAATLREFAREAANPPDRDVDAINAAAALYQSAADRMG